jgi:hypothetical protein
VSHQQSYKSSRFLALTSRLLLLCCKVRDEGLDGLARGCKNLLFLNASDCPRLTHHGFQAFHALRVLRLQVRF